MAWSLPSFLYRRLARFVTCVFQVPSGSIALSDKFLQASFKDVFVHPFYWQVAAFLPRRPLGLVLDCGAHCGHFTALLCHTASCLEIESKNARFILVEPNRWLLPRIAHTLAGFNLTDRARVVRGLLGPKQGSGTLMANPNNPLMGGTDAYMAGTDKGGQQVDFINLDSIVPAGEPIDVMKVDIEGGEYALFREQGDILKRVGLLVIELHPRQGEDMNALLRIVADAGLEPVMPAWPERGQLLQIFKRRVG